MVGCNRCAAIPLLLVAAMLLFQGWGSCFFFSQQVAQTTLEVRGSHLSALPLVQPGRVCTESWYRSSELEDTFHGNPDALTADWTSSCETLERFDSNHTWIERIQNNSYRDSDYKIFSTLCRAGFPAQVIEPLAGVLRDPRFNCSRGGGAYLGVKEYLILADSADFPPQPGTKRIFFDAGGTRFGDQLMWFATAYEKRGLPLDEIYVWEVKNISDEQYWQNVPQQLYNRFHPVLTRYNAVGISDAVGDRNNPMTLVYEKCRPQDFCVFKLDVDTSWLENAVAGQLVNDPGNLKEFFFEHHVQTLQLAQWWGPPGTHSGLTIRHSYDLFARMRQKGVRAHSWI
ncbi:unnamed protein product [Symbiodinium sp. CCMP2592]|nr:unnamed protein product [Symbiodinium sp. CCMP2592]